MAMATTIVIDMLLEIAMVIAMVIAWMSLDPKLTNI